MGGYAMLLVLALCAGVMPHQAQGLRRKRSDDVPPLNGVVEGLSQQFSQMTAQFSALQNRVTSLESKFDTTQTAVAFHAYHNQGTISVASQGTVVFNTVSPNSGTAYDTQTGIFTAPLTGTYVFFTNCMSRDGTEEHSYIKVDGAIIAACYSNKPQGATYEQGGTLSTVHLTAGQRVWVQITENAEDVTGSQWGTFTGFLIQADV